MGNLRNDGGEVSPPRAHPLGGGGAALRLRKCDDQRVGGRWTPPRPLLRGTGPGAGPVSPAPSLRPWARTPHHTPGLQRVCQTLEGPAERPLCRPAAPPAQPRGSPSWWETPEPPQEGKNAPLELSQQSRPPGTSCLPRLSKPSRAPATGTKGLCVQGGPPGRGPAACGPGASTAGRKLCGQAWSRDRGRNRGRRHRREQRRVGGGEDRCQ